MQRAQTENITLFNLALHLPVGVNINTLQMKNTIILTLIFIGLNGSLFAQTQYPKGCYMSLEEIKSKKPSANYNLEIMKRTTGEIRMNGGNDYKLVSPDKSIKRKTLK